MGFHLNLKHPGEMNSEIAMKLLQLAQGITDSATKTAETLDMLEKGQIRVRSDLSFEEKTMKFVSRITGYVVRALLIIALIIGSSLLCTSSTITDAGLTITILFRAVGAVGFLAGIILAILLFRDLKKES